MFVCLPDEHAKGIILNVAIKNDVRVGKLLLLLFEPTNY